MSWRSHAGAAPACQSLRQTARCAESDAERSWQCKIRQCNVWQCNVAALFRRHAGRLVDLLNLGGTILELGDFPERIERRIGEQVRRRLDEGERDKHHA